MKIVKYKKKSNGKYTIYLDDGRELILYEDVILKFNLLISKKVDDKDIVKINDLNFEYDVYYVALNSIKSRFKSVYELKTLLLRKEYPIDLVEKAIDKLIKQGYLDDRSFTKGYINTQIITTSNGPNKIRLDLEKKKIDNSIIDEELTVFDNDIQNEKINKIINKLIKSNRNKGGLVLKQKIINDLKNKGYDYDMISSNINNYSFSNDNTLAKKEYEKLYKKYSSKYEGYELKRIIKEKLFLKGLVYEDE